MFCDLYIAQFSEVQLPLTHSEQQVLGRKATVECCMKACLPLYMCIYLQMSTHIVYDSVDLVFSACIPTKICLPDMSKCFSRCVAGTAICMCYLYVRQCCCCAGVMYSTILRCAGLPMQRYQIAYMYQLCSS